MKTQCILFSLGLSLIAPGFCLAGSNENNIWNGEKLTGGFGRENELLADYGIELDYGITSIYQINTKGGLSAHNRRGRLSGSYDLEMTADMQKFLGAKGGILYIHGQGWWSDSGGIDGVSINSAFGVNGDTASRDALLITELWWEQLMLDDALRIRLGKLDITGGFECCGCPASFDGNAFANDEIAQFLNGALVNNPTIPLTDYGLGAVLYWNPDDWWYASAGVIDAQADARETGIRTSFYKEDYFFYIFETGIAPGPDSANWPFNGMYRVGLWYDPQPKANSDSGKRYRDDIGFYLSCDQMLIRENNDPEESQGLGAFFRYGYADSKSNDVTEFWSLGFQYQGLFQGRDNDVLGIGFAQGFFSDNASSTFSADYESVLELYYNVKVAPWFHLSPGIQYVSNSGGIESSDDALIFGLRTQVTF